ncbi:hypothetical protein ABPG74_022452 [Tetrahymena malaccensis]
MIRSLQNICNKTEFGICTILSSYSISLLIIFTIKIIFDKNSLDKVLDLFYNNIDKQEIMFVMHQNQSLLQILDYDIQQEALLINIILNTQNKIQNGIMLVNPKFRNTLVNIKQSYDNQGDTYLLNLQKSKSYLISSWYLNDTTVNDQIDKLLQDQLKNSSYIDFIWRANLLLNYQSNQLQIPKVIARSYFMIFNYNGLYYGSCVNISQQGYNNQDQNQCQPSNYQLGPICQRYFQSIVNQNETIIQNYPPINFLYANDSKPYVSSGLCKKYLMFKNVDDIYIQQSFQKDQFIFICNSFDLEKKYLFLKELNQTNRVRIIFDPQTLRVIFQTDQQISNNKILNLQESFLDRLEPKSQNYFFEQMKNFQSTQIQKKCVDSKEEALQYAQLAKQKNFQFEVNGGNYTVILQSTFLIDFDIGNLTNQIKKLKISEDTNYSLLFEDKEILQHFLNQSENLQLSKDISFLYLSFQNLFLNLIFMTQSIIGLNESYALIELTKQIQYFKKLNNQRALGICYNNIGNIHFNNERYEEAYDYYSRSIVCCLYEMNFYKDPENKELIYSKINNFQFNKGQSKKQHQLSFVQKIRSIFTVNEQNFLQSPKQIKDIRNQKDQFELISILFTRKYNCFKAIYQYMVSDKNRVGNWDLEVILIKEVQELNFLQNGDRPFLNQRNKIVQNMYLMLIYAKAGLIQQCEEVLKDNYNLYHENENQNILNMQKQKRLNQSSQLKEYIGQKGNDNILNGSSQVQSEDVQSSMLVSQQLKIKDRMYRSFDIDTLDIKKNLDSLIDICYLVQLGIKNFINKQYFQSADYFTQIFEECQTHLQHVKSNSFYQLYIIFQELNISHPLIDKILDQQVNEFSYKISFIYFDLNQQHTSIQNQCEDIIVEKTELKANTIKLCQYIIKSILKNDDDHFGLVYSQLEEMSIQQKISMLNYKFIKKNYDFINKQIQYSFQNKSFNKRLDNCINNLSQNSFLNKTKVYSSKEKNKNKFIFNNEIFDIKQRMDNNQNLINSQSVYISKECQKNYNEKQIQTQYSQPYFFFKQSEIQKFESKIKFKLSQQGFLEKQKQQSLKPEINSQTQYQKMIFESEICSQHSLLPKITEKRYFQYQQSQNRTLSISQQIPKFETQLDKQENNYDKIVQNKQEESNYKQSCEQQLTNQQILITDNRFSESIQMIYSDNQQELVNKKRNMFYYSIRKAIQSLIIFTNNTLDQGLDLFYNTTSIQETLFAQHENQSFLQILDYDIQQEVFLINMILNAQVKTQNGIMLINPIFRNTLLNIQNSSQNQGDSYLLYLYKRKSYMISSWYSKNESGQSNLGRLFTDQLKNSSYIDFIWRANLLLNYKVNQLEKPKLIVKSYFMVFNYNSLYYGSGTNITQLGQANLDQNQCQPRNYQLGSSCLENFKQIINQNETIIQSYPPTHFLYANDSKPYVSLGLCKKQLMPKNLNDIYQQEFLKDPELDAFILICNSFDLEKKYLIFQELNKSNRLRIIFDPQTLRVIFQSDQQISNNTILNLNESFFNRLDNQQKNYFLEQINNFSSSLIQKICAHSKEEAFKYIKVAQQQKFNFESNGNHFTAILQSTFLMDFDKSNSTQIMYCLKSNSVLLTVVELQFLQITTELIKQQIQLAKEFFLVLIYLIIGFSFVINFYYSKYISTLVFESIENLTNAIKKLKINEDTNYSLLFEDKTFLQNFLNQSQDLQLSRDMSLVYESFWNLFLTLIFMTESIIGQNESLALIELTKQIQYFNKLNNQRALGICYNNIGNIHFNNGRYEEAYDYYSRSIVCCLYEMDFYKDSESEQTNQNKENIYSKANSFSIKNEQQKKQQQLTTSQNVRLVNAVNESSFLQNSKQNKKKGKYKDQYELISILFTRKYNCFKTIFSYMVSDKNRTGNWDLEVVLIKEVQELNFLQNGDRPFLNQKNKIVYNMYLLLLYAKAGLIKQCEEVIKENDNLYYSYLNEKQANTQKIPIEGSQIKGFTEQKENNSIINGSFQIQSQDKQYLQLSQQLKVQDRIYPKFDIDKLNIQKNLDNLIHICYLSQLGIKNFITKQYFQSADYFTQIFEQCSTHLQHVKSHSFYQLYIIFKDFNISHPLIDKILNQQVHEYSYKISFIYFDQKQQHSLFENLSQDSIIENQDLSESQNSINLNKELQKVQKSKAIKLCRDIIHTILKKDDDLFGFIYSSLEEMSIQQKISMLNYNFIKKNYQFVNQQIEGSFQNQSFSTSQEYIISNSSQNSSKQKNDVYSIKEKSNKQNVLNNKSIDINQSIGIYQSVSNNQSILISKDYQQNIKENSKDNSINYVKIKQKKTEEDNNNIQDNEQQYNNYQSYKQLKNIIKYSSFESTKQNNLEQQEETVNKKMSMFYYTIRMAIQQLVCQFEEKSILLKLNQMQFYLNHPKIQEQNQFDLKIAVIDDFCFIQKINPSFQMLIENLSKFEIELCVLIQNEVLSINEQNEFENILIDNRIVVSFFFNEISLQIYLDSSRCFKYHDKTPMFIENF